MITGRRRDGRSLWLVGVALTSIAGLTLADEVTGREAKRLDGTWKFVSLRSGQILSMQLRNRLGCSAREQAAITC